MNICVVIVTYNRLDKLKTCLKSYANQSRKPNKIIVVDNASKEETKDFLKEWEKNNDGFEKIVLTLDRNYGGSGGFHYGMKKALEIGFDWLWIADDDAYPDEDAFEILEKKISENPKLKAFCAEVDTNAGIAFNHRRKLVNGIRKYPLEVNSNLKDYKNDKFKINEFSFVGAILNYDVLKECGLPREDFFIWYDDTEYSFRVNEKFEIMCFPEIKIFHDDEQTGNSSIKSWKTYYGERNRLEAYSLHFTKKEFAAYLRRFKLGMVKAFILDRFYLQCRKDALKDFKNKQFGISEKYMSGKKFK